MGRNKLDSGKPTIKKNNTRKCVMNNSEGGGHKNLDILLILFL